MRMVQTFQKRFQVVENNFWPHFNVTFIETFLVTFNDNNDTWNNYLSNDLFQI